MQILQIARDCDPAMRFEIESEPLDLQPPELAGALEIDARRSAQEPQRAWEKLFQFIRTNDRSAQIECDERMLERCEQTGLDKSRRVKRKRKVDVRMTRRDLGTVQMR